MILRVIGAATLALVGSGIHAEITTQQEQAYIKAVFEQIQPVSFKTGVELCGYVGTHADGTVGMSSIYQGGEGHCQLPDFPEGLNVLASFHTHGSHNSDYDSEIPSSDDMLGDEADGIDGWVATPGGRLWYIDTQEMTANLVCHSNCIPVDPGYLASDNQPVLGAYTLNEIINRERGD